MMNKRPGQIKVTIESGYCSFCDRTRNLRREERQLGALVRTVIACESCHRLLSSTMGVASAEPATATPGDGAEIKQEAAAPSAAAPGATEPKPPAARRAPTAPKPKAAGSKRQAPKGRAQRSK
jgi:hypothetical protein